jgi:hypothetical protein
VRVSLRKYRSCLVIFIASLLLQTSAFSEYRAFLLKVTANTPFGGDPVVYYIVSSLDSKHYTGFYGGKTVVQVEALNSWMCPGYTGHFRQVCADPLGRNYPTGAFQLEDL